MNDQSSDQSFLSGANATFINDLYKEWKENSNSVPKEWDLWFKTNADDKLLDEGPSYFKGMAPGQLFGNVSNDELLRNLNFAFYASKSGSQFMMVAGEVEDKKSEQKKGKKRKKGKSNNEGECVYCTSRFFLCVKSLLGNFSVLLIN